MAGAPALRGFCLLALLAGKASAACREGDDCLAEEEDGAALLQGRAVKRSNSSLSNACSCDCQWLASSDGCSSDVCADRCRVANGVYEKTCSNGVSWQAKRNYAPADVWENGRLICSCSWMANNNGLGDDCRGGCTEDNCGYRCRAANPGGTCLADGLPAPTPSPIYTGCVSVIGGQMFDPAKDSNLTLEPQGDFASGGSLEYRSTANCTQYRFVNSGANAVYKIYAIEPEYPEPRLCLTTASGRVRFTDATAYADPNSCRDWKLLDLGDPQGTRLEFENPDGFSTWCMGHRDAGDAGIEGQRAVTAPCQGGALYVFVLRFNAPPQR